MPRSLILRKLAEVRRVDGLRAPYRARVLQVHQAIKLLPLSEYRCKLPVDAHPIAKHARDYAKICELVELKV